MLPNPWSNLEAPSELDAVLGALVGVGYLQSIDERTGVLRDWSSLLSHPAGWWWSPDAKASLSVYTHGVHSAASGAHVLSRNKPAWLRVQLKMAGLSQSKAGWRVQERHDGQLPVQAPLLL